MKKLISMVDYVLQKGAGQMEVQSLSHQQATRVRWYYEIKEYAQFLKRPLELGMFVPVDEAGNVIEKPDLSDANGRQYDSSINEDLAWRNYQQALSRVLFEGVTVEHDMYQSTKRTFYSIGDLRIFTVLEFHTGEVKTNFNLLQYPPNLTTIESLVPFNLTLKQHP